jgi:hypothetical protein
MLSHSSSFLPFSAPGTERSRDNLGFWITVYSRNEIDRKVSINGILGSITYLYDSITDIENDKKWIQKKILLGFKQKEQEMIRDWNDYINNKRNNRKSKIHIIQDKPFKENIKRNKKELIIE